MSHLTHELTEELKDAGFPQDGAVCILNHDHTRKHETDMPHCWCEPRKEVQPNGDMVIVHNENENQYEPGCDYAPYVPTLSELIEACGEGFRMLIHPGRAFYSAYSSYESDPDALRTTGSTPEEAVTRLWLALNKKSTPADSG